MLTLEYDTDVAPTEAIEFGRRKLIELLPGNGHVAFARRKNARKDVQQRRLPTARLPQDQPMLALPDQPLVEPQHLLAVVGVADVLKREHRWYPWSKHRAGTSPAYCGIANQLALL